ncbi:MAG: bifunctional N(6)-L-threonylcarbamoyladenine synthase/serine/threonine protein kinase [Theionarchaea archaeon]|nr:bifunctional N(6)-L-threonylcarbamoyladenine synthase/serine/threonine protein kinase [Theionarchaea archaeon]MBU7037766.1 bifunctional N(6)-L-threonylcarbamoyladenine synthase/serine/threonine protein kinase [Theionarchaea archaeon]
MICLGIESTAHTFGVGIVTEDEVLANESDSYSGVGIHPREAADHHAEVAGRVLKQALKKADIGVTDTDVVSFSKGPGLGPCLRIAATCARTISLQSGIPIVGVNHCIAHVEVGRWVTEACDPVTLYVSGGNTQIIAYAGGRYRVFGETLDIGIGNMQDIFGREAGLPFPCYREMDKMVRTGVYIPGLPYTVKGNDFSFSGLLTQALKMVQEHTVENAAKSLMENAYAMVVEATERAMAHTEKTELLLTGGVAASPRLQEMCCTMCRERDASFYVPPHSLCRDNGAMIAHQGLLEYSHGKRMRLEDTVVSQKWRTDEVEITWR